MASASVGLSVSEVVESRCTRSSLDCWRHKERTERLVRPLIVAALTMEVEKLCGNGDLGRRQRGNHRQPQVSFNVGQEKGIGV